MTTGFEISPEVAGKAASDGVPFGHPDDVLRHPTMSIAEKRALLASWASDARAIPGVPILRQLDDGSVLMVDQILRALTALDDDQKNPGPDGANRLAQAPFERRLLNRWPSWVRRRRRGGDDDEPPCPAHAALPRRGGGEQKLRWRRG